MSKWVDLGESCGRIFPITIQHIYQAMALITEVHIFVVLFVVNKKSPLPFYCY
jgi:hypothetical protein